MTQEFIDFTKLPVDDVILILRRTGFRLLEELLETPFEAGKPLEGIQLPRLSHFFSGQEVDELYGSCIWKVKRKRKTGFIKRNLREKLYKSLKKLSEKAIKGKINADVWNIGYNNRLSIALGGTKGNILPDDFWFFVSQVAWCEPQFQLSAGVRVLKWLRKSRFLAPVEIPGFYVSPNIFWVLIALTEMKPLTFRYWISKRERNRVRLERILKENAHNLVCVDNWAGFWDQWIIDLASQIWPSGFCFLDRKMLNALLEIPFIHKDPITEASKNTKKINLKLKLLLRKSIEFCFGKIDRVKRFPQSGSTRDRNPLLNIIARDWQEKMPAFFPAIERYPDFQLNEEKAQNEKRESNENNKNTIENNEDITLKENRNV